MWKLWDDDDDDEDNSITNLFLLEVSMIRQNIVYKGIRSQQHFQNGSRGYWAGKWRQKVADKTNCWPLASSTNHEVHIPFKIWKVIPHSYCQFTGIYRDHFIYSLWWGEPTITFQKFIEYLWFPSFSDYDWTWINELSNTPSDFHNIC